MRNNRKEGDTMQDATPSKTLMKNALKRKGIREHNEAVGGLGLPSKMPGYAYGISATLCATGSKLREVPGSPCYGCYAMKNNYRYPSVMRSHEKRLASMEDLTAWADSMGKLLKSLVAITPVEERYFRWHDSGDLQGTEHLHAILRVAVRNPEWKFWLPTQERAIVRKVKEQVPVPRNIVIRLSSTRTGKKQRSTVEKLSSTVSYDKGFQCPASNQKNSCGTCRECWNARRINVNYKKH